MASLPSDDALERCKDTHNALYDLFAVLEPCLIPRFLRYKHVSAQRCFTSSSARLKESFKQEIGADERLSQEESK